MTNSQVKLAFANQQPGSSSNLSTDGRSIKSYHWWEIARWIDGVIVTRKGKAYSMTTASKHRPGVYGVEAANQTPTGQADMNL